MTFPDELAAARGELHEARAVVARVDLVARDDEETPAGTVAAVRALIELQVAQFRAALWAQTVDRMEHRARSLGLQP